MNGLHKATITITLVAILSLFACNEGNLGTSTYCQSNFIQGNIGLRLTDLTGSANTYVAQVCYNEDYQGAQVSVFGVETEADIATLNTATDVRIAHMTDGLRPGDEFEIYFNNDDAWFVIYRDNAGNFSTTTEIIRGEFR